jgi:hypothetical protein
VKPGENEQALSHVERARCFDSSRARDRSTDRIAMTMAMIVAQ